MIFKEKSRQTEFVSKSIPSADALGNNNVIPPGFTALTLPSTNALGYDSFIHPGFFFGLAMKRFCEVTSRRNFKPKQNPYL